MDFRLAVMQDLPQLKDMYKQIVKNMNEQNIKIWDDIYPCEFFEEDIKNNQLYVLLNNSEIVSAFVLCDTNSGENAVKWNDNHAKVLYIDRLGVNIKYSKKGIGSLMLDQSKEIAKTFGAEYLRLFVVDINKPAIQLYIRNGFAKADGVYDEIFDDGFVLHEYGYEINLT
jgi:ribosomal protein S18 acetylase RimI-like enzyme